jgi:hypothetical protein
MASIIHPKTGPDGEVLSWDSNKIPSTKPFINIVTSPAGPLTVQDDINFIKTKSLIYTVFHQNARYINFEVVIRKMRSGLSFLVTSGMIMQVFILEVFSKPYIRYLRKIPV